MTHEWNEWRGEVDDRPGMWVQLSVDLGDRKYGAKAFVADCPIRGEFCTVAEARSNILDGVSRRVPMDFDTARSTLAQVAA